MTDVLNVSGGTVAKTTPTDISTAPAATTAATSNNAFSALTKDVGTFLTLLTAQLKNQDPLNPTETADFTNQLVLFTQAEQAIAQNSNLEKLIALSQTSQTSTLVNYIGKKVEAESSNFTLGATGSSLSYELPKDTTKASVNILGADGKLVKQIDGTILAGRNTITWDGKDGLGNQLPAGGSYTFSIDASNVEGTKLAGAKYFSTGVVTGVERDGTNHYLLVGKDRLEVNKVNKIIN